MGYSWTPINKGDIIRAAHFNEIKNNLEDLYNRLELDSPSWTYFPVSVGEIILKDHIQELRDKTDYADDMNYCRAFQDGHHEPVYNGENAPHNDGEDGGYDTGLDTGYCSPYNSGDHSNYKTNQKSGDKTSECNTNYVNDKTSDNDVYCGSNMSSVYSDVQQPVYSAPHQSTCSSHNASVEDSDN